MFFFIAGVQPKTLVLDAQPRKCPACGLYQASLKRTDHYLSIFFLPLLRVKKGSPFLACQRCGNLSHASGGLWHRYQQERPVSRCPHCGEALSPDFQYCPYCGKSV